MFGVFGCKEQPVRECGLDGVVKLLCPAAGQLLLWTLLRERGR